MGFAAFDAPYPWDAVVGLREQASAHPDGLVDLSIGTPVDPTPAIIQAALAGASDAPGYPTVAGPVALRQAVVDWYARARGVSGLTPDQVLPAIGSKEAVALLPSQLGLGPEHTVVIPSQAYPTYEVGARLAGANVLVSDDPHEWADRSDVALVWLNSPANPTGEVLGVERLAEAVRAARALGAVVAGDECYALLPWAAPWTSEGVPSVLDPRVTGGDLTGVLALHSLSKQSNLAGYRAAFIAGDREIVARLLLQRRHLGMMLPAPIQAAMAVAIADDAHVADQVARYRSRRELLVPALEAVGFEIDHSEAGLYLWVRAGERLASRLTSRHDGDVPPAASEAPCWVIMRFLAEHGILAGPGEFYGPAAAGHVRISLTASDERIAAAAERLLNWVVVRA